MRRSLVLLAIAGCAGSPDGLRRTPEGSGPTVVVDWDALPLPEIPFPNDLATRADPTSVTGLRLNISKIGVTDTESEARTKLDELVGFGIFAPISVAFDAPLDLDEIVARHPNDLDRADRFGDDAILVLDVTPGSPTYLQPVDLDVGNGRYPVDIEGVGTYWDNDPRADAPTLLFESETEDLDGDGALDWGEDTDNDGLLDTPNVYPLGGDPRDDLLTFYERQSDTLMVRPVVPLREETRYAVVLTERLIGEDGQPVRSPWTWVNHVRQTDALAPVVDALPDYGLSVDDVAYAWVFTTGRVTADLVDIHRGLFDGEGPWPFLHDDYPARIEEAAELHTLPGSPTEYLPAEDLVARITGLGALGDPNTEAMLAAAYEQFGGGLVGGAYTSPNLLVDRDDGGADDSDEWWQLDPVAGTMSVAPRRIVFTCALPKESDTVHAPFPVALYGHGHGSNRFEVLLFAWALNRMGIAVCAIDWPGHGLDLSAEEEVLIGGLLEAGGLGATLTHLQDDRARDLDNDGRVDSGADQWISDPFHSRDMVRQGVVDWMQLVRALKTCGTGEMDVKDREGRTVRSVASCDWDEDGAPDIGGADVNYFLLGGSLGGIDSAVAAAVIPEATATAAIVPGGGLLDVGIRSDLGGVISAVVGRMLTPLIVGLPTDAGDLQITQIVNAYMDTNQVAIATVPLGALPGGRIVVENLDNGEVREGWIPPDGRFRLAIPADALTGVEKRLATGMPDTGPGTDVWTVPDNAGLGDRLVITLYDASGAELTRIDSWQADTTYEGITYPAGSPLVAASHGLGHIRGSPALRRLVMATALAMEPADPVSFGPHWFREPFAALGGRPTNVLVQPTSGDQSVTISAGIALARAAGLVELHEVDPRYGMPVDRWLIERDVLHGLEAYGPYVDGTGAPALFDVDDLDEGTDGTGAPSEAPLRSNVETAAGVSALRLSYPRTTGMHGFDTPDPERPFDTALYVMGSIGKYFVSEGAVLDDDVCMGTDSCPDIPSIVLPEP
ncbi:MAG: hypothetical protein ABMB14_15070 [Myxococcota bacterium]